MNNNTIMLATIIIYLGGMLSIGIYYSRKNTKQEDFLLGGRKIPGWALALSERATGESVWMVLAASGFVYAKGVSSIILVIASILGPSIGWSFLSKHMMKVSIENDALTVPAVLSNKFSENAKTIRFLCGVLFSAMLTFYIAAQFSGAGKTLMKIFGVDPIKAMILVAVFTIIYAFLGGFFAVVWTDVVQALLMVCLFIGLPIVAFIKVQAGGLSVSQALADAGPAYNTITQGASGFPIFLIIIANFSFILSALGRPELHSRYMAVRNEKEQKTARNIAIGWSLFAYMGVFAIGILGIVLYGPGTITDRELLVPQMLTDLLPPWLAGVMLAAILAAMMSTADSLLLVVTSSVSEDIVHAALGKKLTEKQLVKLSRLVVIGSGLLGLVLGMTANALVFTIINWYTAGVACSFAAIILLTLFWKKLSGKAIVPMIICGFATTVIWMSTGLEKVITSRFVVFALNIVVGIVISLIFAKKNDKINETQAID
ncbi:sodium/proline symporter [Wukongibacter baidiensis]|uniref:sodium/proline symporter n=1 Tax=Wukongibacter baidiensis TaxID=1723361 RepID=UPI003D7FDA54